MSYVSHFQWAQFPQHQFKGDNGESFVQEVEREKWISDDSTEVLNLLAENCDIAQCLVRAMHMFAK